MLHVVVADNSTVRVYETIALGSALVAIAAFHNPVGKHERDMVTSRPGQVINRAAGIPQSYEPKVSARQQLTQRWLKLVGAQLQLLLTGHKSAGMILVAAPRLLAEFRRQLPTRTRALILGQLARDLTHHPVSVLTKRVQPAMRAAARAQAEGF